MQKKKYKECLPENTTSTIKQILNDMNIVTEDIHMKSGKFFSCRINLLNDNLDNLNIGTNGKGRSFNYSMASGYAELVERLSNRMLTSERIYATKKYIDSLDPNSQYVRRIKEANIELNFLYDHAEEIWDIEKIIAHSGNILLPFFAMNEKEFEQFISQKYLNSRLTMIPFWDVTNTSITLLPYEIILMCTGSNGMAAGNSDEEAILQAIFEIFERYSISEIVNKNICPPSIPLSFFENPVLIDQIKSIEKENNYSIIIKDCSLGIQLPVIGVLIIDQANGRYNFSLGADSQPEIALERCMTEMYQNSVDFNDIPLDFTSNQAEANSESNKHLQIRKIIADGSGNWPFEIFSNNESYSFNGFKPEFGHSNTQDIQECMSIIKKIGFNMYVRNNSYLGFPSFHIVIPGMSQMNRISPTNHLYSMDFDCIADLQNLGQMSSVQMCHIADILASNHDIIIKEGFNFQSCFPPNVNKDLKDLDINLLLFMLYYRVGKIPQAYEYMLLFLQGKDVYEFNYFYAVKDYVYFKYIKCLDDETYRYILGTCYGIDTCQEVIDDMHDQSSIFKYYDLPTCPNCEDCKIKADCNFFDLLKIEHKLNSCHLTNYINQSKISTVFSKLK